MYVCPTTRELKAAGWSTYQIRKAAACCLKVVRRGAYVVTAHCADPGHDFAARLVASESVHLPKEKAGLLKDKEDHRIMVRSYVNDLLDGCSMSHMSALVVHELPIPYFTGVPHFDRDEPFFVEAVHPINSVRGKSMVMRQRTIDESDLIHIKGIPVTSILRTLWDVAHDYPLAFAVAVIDASIYQERISERELRSYFAAHPARNRQRTIDRVLENIDGSRESVAESICAVRLVEHSIVGFLPQVEFRDKYGRVEARADFTNEEAKVIAEVDGQAKYFLPGVDVKKAFEQERAREYKLRNRGYQVFRIRWGDLFTATVFEQIKAAVKQRLAESGARVPG